MFAVASCIFFLGFALSIKRSAVIAVARVASAAHREQAFLAPFFVHVQLSRERRFFFPTARSR